MLKNVTITLEEGLLKSARVTAAKRGLSVSKLVAEIIAREVRQEDRYWQAFEGWKKIKPVPTLRKVSSLSREEAHERG